ncbi:MAG: hypothetical protein ABGX16_22335 [Pirellulales bacterium]
MQRREKILLIAACGAILIWIGLPMVERIFVTPIAQRQATLSALGEEIIEKTNEVVQIKKAGVSLKQWRQRSLPPVPLDAQRLYQAWLTDLAQLAGFSDLRVTPGRRIENASIYTGSLVTLEGKGTLAQLSDFLQKFYHSDLLHRVVSLNIDSPAVTGDPQLEFTLIAEGVSLAGTPPREHLFPQTTLKTDFRSTTVGETGEQTGELIIEIDNAKLFPAGSEFRIRLNDEFLHVIKSKGTEWTVRGESDRFRPTEHKAGDVVELALLRPDDENRSTENLQQLVENSPFVKPKVVVAIRTPPPSTPPAPSPQPVDRTAEETYLGASIRKDGEPEAWLYRNGTRTTVLHRNSEIAVGDVKAVVKDIHSDYVVLESNEKLWRLRIGRNLKSLEEIATSQTPSDPGR